MVQTVLFGSCQKNCWKRLGCRREREVFRVRDRPFINFGSKNVANISICLLLLTKMVNQLTIDSTLILPTLSQVSMPHVAASYFMHPVVQYTAVDARVASRRSPPTYRRHVTVAGRRTHDRRPMPPIVRDAADGPPSTVIFNM